MSQQFPRSAPVAGDINVNSPVKGHIVLIGQNNHLELVIQGVKDRRIDLDDQDPRLETMVQLVNVSNTRLARLAAAGLPSGIAPFLTQPEDPDSADPLGAPGGVAPPLTDDAEQMSKDFSKLEQVLRSLDQQLGGKVLEITHGRQHLSRNELLFQRGNLAFWRFRQGAVGLFAEQASLYYLVQSHPTAQPMVRAFQMAARENIEVLRAWVLFQKYRKHQPPLLNQTTAEALRQGDWREVLDHWQAQGLLSRDKAQYEQVYLSAIGQPYNQQAAQAAAQEAEFCFTEVLRYQPDHSAALVNLAALTAERSLLTSIETGQTDRVRLEGARSLFQQARALLEKRPDAEGRQALAQCLLYEATALPPDADLAGVQWATEQVEQMRARLGQDAQQSIRWEIILRNLARHNPTFFNWPLLKAGRDMLISAGISAATTTALDLLIQSRLADPALMAHPSQSAIAIGRATHQLPPPPPSPSGTLLHPHGPSTGPQPFPGAHGGHLSGHLTHIPPMPPASPGPQPGRPSWLPVPNANHAGKTVSRGAAQVLLGTMYGKIIAVVLAAGILVGSGFGIARLSHPSGTSSTGSSASTSTNAPDASPTPTPFPQHATTGQYIIRIYTGRGYDKSTNSVIGETATFHVGDRVYVVITNRDWPAPYFINPYEFYAPYVYFVLIQDNTQVFKYDHDARYLDAPNSAEASAIVLDPGIYEWEIGIEDYNGNDESPDATIMFQVLS